MTRATIPPHVERFLGLLHGVRQRGAGWTACCPAHDDTHPSLDVDVGDENQVLVICRSGGCSVQDITAAVGLTVRDLFADDGRRNGHAAPPPPRRAAQQRPAGEPMTLDGVLTACRRSGHVGGHWIYSDASGTPALLVVRIEPAKAPKQFRQLRAVDGDRWAWGSPEGLRPLFALPALLADPGREVLVVEGEKCVEAVQALGFLATTSAGGAQAARRADWSPLAGRDVVLLADYDRAGIAYATEVAEILRGLGARVRIVELPMLLVDGERVDDLREGDDVADLIERRRERGLGDAEIVDGIVRRIEAVPAAEAEQQRHADDWPESSIDELTARPPLEWLVESLVPEQSVVVLAGHPGAGKSFLALDLACRLTHSMVEWMGEAITRHGPVAYVALEGGGGIAGRIRAWRRQHSAQQQVHPLQIIEPDDNAAPLSPEAVGSTRQRLRRWADRHGAPVLVVVDTATLAIDGDENDAATWRAALRCAAQIAREHCCAVELLLHLRKPGQGKPEPLTLASVRGSGATGGNVDQVLGAEKVDDESPRRLLCLKAKDGIEAPPREYALDIVCTGIARRCGREETSCVVRSLGIIERGTAPAAGDWTLEARKQLLAASSTLQTSVSADDLCRRAKLGPGRARHLCGELADEGRIGRRQWRDGKYRYGPQHIIDAEIVEASRPARRDGDTTPDTTTAAADEGAQA